MEEVRMELKFKEGTRVSDDAFNSVLMLYVMKMLSGLMILS